MCFSSAQKECSSYETDGYEPKTHPGNELAQTKNKQHLYILLETFTLYLWILWITASS